METTAVNTKPIGEMTPDEIRAYLDQQEQDKKAEEVKRKKQAEADKKAFLRETFSKFSDLRTLLAALKTEAIEGAEKHNALKYELEGKKPKEAKSFELKDEHIRIVVETQERFDFTDQAIVHISAIKDIFRAKFEERNKGLYNLLDGILMKNSKGEYDAKLLTKARNQAAKLGDEALIAEFDKLTDCQTVTGTAKYIRVYERVDNKWKDISLNFSSL